jgi:hypothetical protein
MTTIPSTVNNYIKGSEILARSTQEQISKTYVGGSCATYRLNNTQISGIILYQALIPLKAPCVYLIRTTYNCFSSTGSNTFCAAGIMFGVSQFAQGSPILGTVGSVLYSTTYVNGVANPGAVPTITFTKSPTSDAIDVTINTTGLGVSVNQILTLELYNSANF